jgi:hypothetical protein
METNMERGYMVTYRWVIKLLQDCDFAESARRLGLKLVSANRIAINFLGREYDVTKDGIELAEEKLRWSAAGEGYDYDLKSVLGYYVLSEANREPRSLSGEPDAFCALEYFSHGVFRNSDWNHDALGKVFGADYDKFRRTAEKLGMTFEAQKSSGQYIWRYTLLPKIPVKLVYYEGDDEYPTKIQILFDKTAIEFYKFEPLAVLYSCFIGGLAAIGEMVSP